jgi:hypothetical protein
MKFLSTLFCVTFLALCSQLSAESSQVSLTNLSGQTIKVSLQKYTKSTVTVQLRANRKIHTLQLTDLDNASLTKIKAWQEAGGGLSNDFEIDFNPGKTTRSADSYDNRSLVIKPVVTIKNGDNNLATQGAEVTVITLGKPAADTSLIKVFQKEKHKLPALDGLGQYIVTNGTYRTTYDDRGYKYGTKYMGYVVLVHRGKTIITSKSLPESLAEKFGAKFFKLQSGMLYDKMLDEVKGSSF